MIIISGFPWSDGNVLTGSELTAPFYKNRMAGVVCGSSGKLAAITDAPYANDGNTTTYATFQFSSGIDLGSNVCWVQWDLGSFYKYGYFSMYGGATTNNANANQDFVYVWLGSPTSWTTVNANSYVVNGTALDLDIPYYNLQNIANGARYVRITCTESGTKTTNVAVDEIMVFGGHA